ncbi:MAG TPA: hypothetical protein DDW76_27695 [Cyanobacteria bacterium UBA11369]|nr:hypothetical protein [Cyanobacteria bacterium UBA11371]HBE30754.1 hypothetical protein [Cyanobacteria bacterium UBA11368]HBE52451.1 hypothetical protein [Cyanobacteria bacterium UBA11369]
MFAKRKGEKEAVLQGLIDRQVPISIGSRDLSVEQMRELWEAVKRKFTQMQADGTWNGWPDFYNQMSTLAKAESFLGVSLK